MSHLVVKKFLNLMIPFGGFPQENSIVDKIQILQWFTESEALDKFVSATAMPADRNKAPKNKGIMRNRMTVDIVRRRINDEQHWERCTW